MAVPVSQRGVVFFRNQTIGVEDQKLLVDKLGRLSGKPDASNLYRNAVSTEKLGHSVDENGKLDEAVTALEPGAFRAMSKDKLGFHKLASHGWHSE